MHFVMLVPKSLDPAPRASKLPVPDPRPSEKIAKLFPQTDPAKDKIIADLNARVRQVRARLPAWFGTLPKAEVTIKRVPKTIEAAQPLGCRALNHRRLDW